MTSNKGPRTVPNWPDYLQEKPRTDDKSPRNFVPVLELQIENTLQQTGLLTQDPRNIVRHTRRTAH